MKPCSWCDNQFKPLVSYQVYCSSNCRDQATKEKIAARYTMAKRKKRRGKERMCISGCGSPLSIYNDDVLCNNCRVNPKEVAKALKAIRILGK